MMDEPFYIGHETQLRDLAEALSVSIPNADKAPALFFHVSGPPGAGKQCFLNRLWDRLSGGEVPRLFFTLSPSPEEDLDFAAQLVRGAKTNRSYLGETIKAIGSSIQLQNEHLEEAGRPLPTEARLTMWADMVEQQLIEDPKNNRNLQIIIALPDFPAFAPQIQEMLARLFPRKTESVDCRIIVTSALKETGAQLQKLFPERMPPEEVSLPALTIDEVEQWAQAKQFPHEFVPELYQRCGGLPGRLDMTAQEVKLEQQERVLIIQAEELLAQFNQNEREWVCMAAMLPEINVETLQAVLTDDQASMTMLALRQSNWPDGTWRERTLCLGEQTRVALIKYLERKYVKSFRKIIPVAEQLGAIHKAIPSGEHREILARLTAFNYFNNDLLREVMGPLADQAIEVVSAHQGYFENSGSNMRMRQDIRHAAENYIKLIKYEIPDAEKRKISAAWDQKRDQILAAMANSEEKIKAESDALETIHSQIKRLSGEIDNESVNLNRLRRRARQKQEAPPSGSSSKNPVWQIVMQALGFVILYISILLSSRASLFYAAVGIGLMFGGLFIKGGMLAHATVTPDMTASPSDGLDKHERNLHFLNLKRGQLQTRHNLAALSIARERSAVKEFDKQLREPYS